MSVDTEPAAVCDYVLAIIGMFVKHVLQQQQQLFKSKIENQNSNFVLPLHTFIDGIDELLIKQANNAQQAQLLHEHKIKQHLNNTDLLLQKGWTVDNVAVNPGGSGVHGTYYDIRITAIRAGHNRTIVIHLHWLICDNHI